MVQLDIAVALQGVAVVVQVLAHLPVDLRIGLTDFLELFELVHVEVARFYFTAGRE